MGGTLWRKIGAPGANITAQSTARPRKGPGCATIYWTMVMDALRTETTVCPTHQSEKIYLTNQCLTVMIKKEMYNLMQNEVEKMKISVGAMSVGAMSELLKMFYDSLIQQNFTPEQAIQLTSDYMKAVFGK